MLQHHILTILIFLPLASALVVALLPKGILNLSKGIALGVSLVQLVLGGYMFVRYQPSPGVHNINGFQFSERIDWIRLDLQGLGKLSTEYFVGVDGLSISLVLLSIVVLLVGVIASWSVEDRKRGYFSLYLLLNASIIGCFVALDFLLFYLFFEFMLLPMYFLIGLWGGPRREYASIKFFLYTLLGSIFILMVMIGLYASVIHPEATAVEMGLVGVGEFVTGEIIAEVQRLLQAGEIPADQMVKTFNLVYMADPANLVPGSFLDNDAVRMVMNYPARFLAFLCLFVGFAIKVPAVPVHTWLPDAHVEAPTPISVILAGILLKIGGYGLLRTAYLIFPDGALHYAWWIGLVGVISIIYGALNALSSQDLKRLIAYSSISHMGFVLLGLASLTAEGVSGAIYQMVSHGLISTALFLIAGVLYDRTHDRMIENYSGLAAQMPQYTVMVVIFFFASMGLPGFSGFIAEILVLLGAFGASTINGLLPKWMAIIAALGLILSAAYYLWTIQRMFFGKLHVKIQHGNNLPDLGKREILMLIPLAVLTLLLGIIPSTVLDLVNDSVTTFVDVILSTGMKNLQTP